MTDGLPNTPDQVEALAQFRDFVVEMREVSAIMREAGEDDDDIASFVALMERLDQGSTDGSLTREEAAKILEAIVASYQRARERFAISDREARKATEAHARVRAKLEASRVALRRNLADGIAKISAWHEEAVALLRLVPSSHPDRPRLLSAVSEAGRRVREWQEDMRRLDEEDQRMRERDAESAQIDAAVAATETGSLVTRARALADAQHRRHELRAQWAAADRRRAARLVAVPTAACARRGAVRRAPRARTHRRLRRCARAPSVDGEPPGDVVAAVGAGGAQ